MRFLWNARITNDGDTGIRREAESLAFSKNSRIDSSAHDCVFLMLLEFLLL